MYNYLGEKSESRHRDEAVLFEETTNCQDTRQRIAA